MNRVRMRNLGLVARFVACVFPEVESELSHWRQRLERARDEELRRQGLDSICKKRFHAQGGSIYALFATAGTTCLNGRGDHPQTCKKGGLPRLIPFIVAFQTISDYLDNLCDRAHPLGGHPVPAPESGHSLDIAAFRQLHLAFTDALNPDGSVADYYRFYPYKDDGGYLQAMVEKCRQSLRLLPSYPLVQEEALRLARLYSDLQSFKHTLLPLREGLLQNWFAVHAGTWPDLDWWEFAAATGSTLGIFALSAAAADPDLTPATVCQLSTGYFPWITGLHILLDYFIDQAEDEAGGDLNFVSYYKDADQCRERLLLFLTKALDCAASLPEPSFHTTVVRGLPAFYLSDPKVSAQGFDYTADALLAAGGRETCSMYQACRVLRWLGKL